MKKKTHKKLQEHVQCNSGTIVTGQNGSSTAYKAQ